MRADRRQREADVPAADDQQRHRRLDDLDHDLVGLGAALGFEAMDARPLWLVVERLHGPARELVDGRQAVLDHLSARTRRRRMSPGCCRPAVQAASFRARAKHLQARRSRLRR